MPCVSPSRARIWGERTRCPASSPSVVARVVPSPDDSGLGFQIERNRQPSCRASTSVPRSITSRRGGPAQGWCTGQAKLDPSAGYNEFKICGRSSNNATPPPLQSLTSAEDVLIDDVLPDRLAIQRAQHIAGGLLAHAVQRLAGDPGDMGRDDDIGQFEQGM